MRRGIEKPCHSLGDTRLVALASVEQREPFESSELRRSDLDGHQQTVVPLPLPVERQGLFAR